MYAVIGSDGGGQIASQQAALCDPYRSGANQLVPTGYILFPDDKNEVKETAIIPLAEIEHALRDTIIKGRVVPIIISCIDYQFPFANGHHQTRYVQPLSEGIPNFQSAWFGFFAPTGTPQGVILTHSIVGESAD